MEDNENINNDDLMNSSMFSSDAGGGEDEFGSIFDDTPKPEVASKENTEPVVEEAPPAQPSKTVEPPEEKVQAEPKSGFDTSLFAENDEENTPVKEPENEPIQVIEEDSSQEEDDGNNKPKDVVTVRPVKFKKFEATPPLRTIKKNLDIMQDVLLHVSVELGRTKSSIKEVMDYEQGSIVELNKIAGEQVEVFVNGKIVAKGEVIVIEDRFGVRITSTNVSKTSIP